MKQEDFTYFININLHSVPISVSLNASNNQVQQNDPTEATGAGGIGVARAPEDLQQQVTRTDRFKELADAEEHQRLHAAPMNRFVDY
jgi:hypothetical protein